MELGIVSLRKSVLSQTSEQISLWKHCFREDAFVQVITNYQIKVLFNYKHPPGTMQFV